MSLKTEIVSVRLARRGGESGVHTFVLRKEGNVYHVVRDVSGEPEAKQLTLSWEFEDDSQVHSPTFDRGPPNAEGTHFLHQLRVELTRWISSTFSTVPVSLREVRRVVILGIHGWNLVHNNFRRGGLLERFGGETPSLKFCLFAKIALLEFLSKIGLQEENVEVTLIPLESFRRIQDRVAAFYNDLTCNEASIRSLREADIVLLATHSQGVPVSMMLLDALLHGRHQLPGEDNSTAAAVAVADANGVSGHGAEEHLDDASASSDAPPAGPTALLTTIRKRLPSPATLLGRLRAQRVTPVARESGTHAIDGPLLNTLRQRVGVIGMAGVNHGTSWVPPKPVQWGVEYWSSKDTKELFMLRDPTSAIHREYLEAARRVLSSRVRIACIASYRDKVVDLYSATLDEIESANILRCLYLDKVAPAAPWPSLFSVFQRSKANPAVVPLVAPSDPIGGAPNGLPDAQQSETASTLVAPRLIEDGAAAAAAAMSGKVAKMATVAAARGEDFLVALILFALKVRNMRGLELPSEGLLRALSLHVDNTSFVAHQTVHDDLDVYRIGVEWILREPGSDTPAVSRRQSQPPPSDTPPAGTAPPTGGSKSPAQQLAELVGELLRHARFQEDRELLARLYEEWRPTSPTSLELRAALSDTLATLHLKSKL